MSYPTTDVICCFPGIGRTTFSAEANVKEHSTFCLDLDYDGVNLNAFMTKLEAERKKKEHRYILIPMDALVLLSLKENFIPHLVVVPDPNDFDDWAKRWMHKGASAETIITRYKRWREIQEAENRGDCVIFLHNGDWLGNLLEQTPATVADGRDT